MRVLTRLFIVFFLSLASISAAHADQFPRFTIERFEGWVEDTDTTNGRIAVIPIIVEPGVGYYWQDPEQIGTFSPVDPYAAGPKNGFDFTPDGRIAVSYRIINDTSYLPGNFKDRISKQTGIPLSRLNKYTVTFIAAASVVSVELEIAGESIAREDFPSGLVITGGRKEGTFYLKDDKSRIDMLRNGQFRLILTSNTPMAQFGSIQIDVGQDAITRSWITAFREVTKAKRRSGFNAGFVDFSKAVQRVRVEEQIQSNSSTNVDTRVDAILRDPTPEQEERFKSLMGFMTQSLAEAIQQHRTALAAAQAAGQLNLATAHDQYIDVLEDKAPGDSDQILTALAKLSNDEAMKFMTAGFRMSLGATSTSYKYKGTSTSTVSLKVQNEYNEFIVKNSAVLNRTVSYHENNNEGIKFAIDSAYRRLDQRIFGTPSLENPLFPTPQLWAKGVAGSIAKHNSFEARYALVTLADDDKWVGAMDPNLPIDGSGNRLLHRAVVAGKPEIVEMLLRAGADPRATNALGETPIDRAEDHQNDAMVSLLQQYAGQTGTAVITVTYPVGLQMVDVRLKSPTATGEIALEPVNATTTRIVINGYPQRLRASIELTYRFLATSVPPGGFPFASQQVMTPTGLRVTATTPIIQAMRIRKGQTQSFNTSLTFAGPAVGFVTPDLMTPPTPPY